MVYINEMSPNRAAKSNSHPSPTIINCTDNANRNANKTAVARPKKRKVVAQLQQERDPNGSQDEEDVGHLQGAHRFKNGHLIMTLVGWVKKPSVEHDLSGVLAEYNANAGDNPNFIEAALIIQEAGKLYDKKVELLMKNIMQAQLRIVKSFNIINAEELQKIEKKMRKRKLTQIDDQQQNKKRNRRRKNWMLRPEFRRFAEKIQQVLDNTAWGQIKEPHLADLYTIESKYLEPMKAAFNGVLKWQDPDFVKAHDEKYRKEYEERFIPLEEYIFRPFVEKSRYIAYESPDKDQIVHSENLLMSDHNFYHEKKCKWYEVFYNKADPKTMMDVTVWEDAVFKHRMANIQAENLLDLFDNYEKYDDSECDKFLMENLTEEYKAVCVAETLIQKCIRMCPYKLKVVAFRLPDDFVKRQLERQKLRELEEQDDATSEDDQRHLLREPVASTSREAEETVSSLADKSNGEQELLLALEDKTAEAASPAIIAPDGGEPDDDSDNGPSEANETTEEVVGLAALTAGQRRAAILSRCKSPINLRERKPKKTRHEEYDDDDNDEYGDLEKPPTKKRRFKLRIATTVNFLDYERFFCENYAPEEREGAVLPLPPPPEPEEPPEAPDDCLDTTEPEEYVPRIPPLPAGEIITPEIRRFNELQARIAENREERRWYSDWESKIHARIKEQASSKFDIHEYGKNLIKQFPEGKPDTPVRFKDMVEGQSNVQVIRNFMAAIHLATSMNIDVSGTTPGKLCNDTLEFRLLSREMHHETLMAFEAPSEVRVRGGKEQRYQKLGVERPTFIVEEMTDSPMLLKEQQMVATKRLVRTPKSRKTNQQNHESRDVERRSSLIADDNWLSSQPLAKTPVKSVSFSESSDIIRCTTTIVKTPSSFMEGLLDLAATSTPSKRRSSHLRSFDSGILSDGCLTSPEQSPLSSSGDNNDVRRLTIDDVLFDVDMLLAGPSNNKRNLSGCSLSDLDDTLSVCLSDEGNSMVWVGSTTQQKGGGGGGGCTSKKRHLDFGIV